MSFLVVRACVCVCSRSIRLLLKKYAVFNIPVKMLANRIVANVNSFIFYFLITAVFRENKVFVLHKLIHLAVFPFNFASKVF